MALPHTPSSVRSLDLPLPFFKKLDIVPQSRRSCCAEAKAELEESQRRNQSLEEQLQLLLREKQEWLGLSCEYEKLRVRVEELRTIEEDYRAVLLHNEELQAQLDGLRNAQSAPDDELASLREEFRELGKAYHELKHAYTHEFPTLHKKYRALRKDKREAQQKLP